MQAQLLAPCCFRQYHQFYSCCWWYDSCFSNNGINCWEHTCLKVYFNCFTLIVYKKFQPIQACFEITCKSQCTLLLCCPGMFMNYLHVQWDGLLKGIIFCPSSRTILLSIICRLFCHALLNMQNTVIFIVLGPVTMIHFLIYVIKCFMLQEVCCLDSLSLKG